jgi:hypothetical protein
VLLPIIKWRLRGGVAEMLCLERIGRSATELTGGPLTNANGSASEGERSMPGMP